MPQILKRKARWLYAASIAMLACGVLASALVYWTADDSPAEGMHYIIVGGEAHPVDPTLSKTYARDLQRFGGRAALLFDEFNRWFASLWHGKALAATVLWLAIAASALLLFLAWRENGSRR
jgi:hypothetical protein